MFKNKIIIRPKKDKVIEQETDHHELVVCVPMSLCYGTKVTTENATPASGYMSLTMKSYIFS